MLPTNFTEWKDCIVYKCGIALTNEYAQKRIIALKDNSDTNTIQFKRLYGDEYTQLVISWFLQALSTTSIKK